MEREFIETSDGPAVLKRRLESTISHLLPSRCRPRVLYYHSVHPDATLSHRPERFRDQLRWLKDQGYSSFTLSRAGTLLAQGELPAKTVVITFDDGYEDNARYALPILQREDFVATFFVVSSLIADESITSNRCHKLYAGLRMMTKSQVRELASTGMEIGSHTRSHVNVRSAIETSFKLALDELRGSREELENIIGETVTTFAYPNGQKGVFSRKTRDALDRSGYQFAVTTMWGGLSSSCDLLQLPRMEIRNTDCLEIFSRKLEGKYDFMIPYCRMVTRSNCW